MIEKTRKSSHDLEENLGHIMAERERERESEHSPAVELIFVPKCEREGGSGTRETLNRRFVSRVTFFSCIIIV